ETKNSKFLIAGGYAHSAINKERMEIALENYKKDKKDWKKHCGKKFKDNGCQQVLACINAIDKGENPHDILLEMEIVEEEIVKETDIPVPKQEIAPEKTEAPKKKRRWFGGK
ncbi:MAG: hypothetical protein K2I23_02365, partial [Clostridia bacterium]|nr:hypothetical protein [Clostridia bacterium]